MATLLARACETTLNRGLLRAYRRVDTDDRVVRGRIRWERQARRAAPLPIAVRYSVHDDDILENQLVREALRVMRHGRLTDPRASTAIDRLWRRMQHLTPLPDPVASLDRLTWTRQNHHYRPLLALATTILTNHSVDLGAGHVPVVSFTLRLYDVFEQFVRVALREASGLPASDFPTTKTRRLSLAEGGAVPLYPDLGVRIQDHGVSSET
jgi:5-methylcytosine-specific restriction enzyme subunit McrC